MPLWSGDGVGEGRRLPAGGDGIDLGLFTAHAFLERRRVVLFGYLVEWRHLERRSARLEKRIVFQFFLGRGRLQKQKAEDQKYEHSKNWLFHWFNSSLT